MNVFHKVTVESLKKNRVRTIVTIVGIILSAAMMLRFTFDLDEEATAIEKAVEAVLDKNYRTGDIMSAGCTQVGCTQMGDLLAAEI